LAAALLGLSGGVITSSIAWSSDFIQRLDANGNSLLESSELSDRVRPLIERAARHAGLDPSRPIPIEKLRQGRRGGSDRSRGDSRRDGDERGARDHRGADGDAEPLVPGFGVPQELPAVPGFGAGEAGPDGEESRRSSDGERDRDRDRSRGRGRDDDRRRWGRSSDNSSNDNEERYRRYAEGMIRRYDGNRNGRLEKDEWSGMRGEPQKADKNGDGVITQEEMLERLLSYSRERSGGGGRDESRSGSSSSSSSSTRSTLGESSAAPHRFLTAVERLPEGLPDWFRDRDRDADGQVMMHEYSSSWSSEKAEEFARYDRNRDGVIIPNEALPSEDEGTESRSEDRSNGDRGHRRSWRRR
jgi:hypothetical protein